MSESVMWLITFLAAYLAYCLYWGTASAKLTAWWGTDYLLLARYEGRWMIRQVLWQTPHR